MEEERCDDGGRIRTRRSWICSAGERRSHSCDLKEVLRRYGVGGQSRRGEMRRANIRAKNVYRQAPKEYIGTGTERRNYCKLC